MSNRKKIAIIGGTGKEGKGLAVRWLKAGHRVFIGSRNYQKAQNAVKAIKEIIPGKWADQISGGKNEDVICKADICVLTVPYKAHKSILELLKENLKDKILIDVTVPIIPPKVSVVNIPSDGSAAKEAQKILGDSVQVVSAFQNVSYEKLLTEDDVDCDVLVSGGTKDAREVVLDLVRDAGLMPWDAGPIENSIIAEGLTSILIGINKKFGTQSAGIRITGVPRPNE